jgi:hypothetical protein
MEPLSPESLSLEEPEAANPNTPSIRLGELASASTGLAQLVAKNPCAPSSLLAELSESKDAITRQNVAANPNTPTEVLLKLGAEFPEELLNNPVFSLLLLEKPNLAESIPTSTLASLVKLETVPVSVVNQAVKKVSNQEILLALANRNRTPCSALIILAEHSYEEVKYAAQLHVKLAGKMTQSRELKTIQNILSEWDVSLDVKGMKILKYIGVFTDAFKSLPKIFRHLPSIAANPITPVSLLMQLAEDSDLEIRRDVASNPNTPVSVLMQLAKDSDSEVRSNVAANPNTPVSLLVQLTKDSNWLVRRDVASNPNTPVSLLVRLAEDSDSEVRSNVAANLNTPVSLLVQLTKDSNWLVRRDVASNPNTPVSLLVRLAKDSDLWVRRKVASNSNTPVSLLVRLAKYSDLEIRRNVAANPNTPVSVLMQLAEDSYLEVRRNVAANPNTPVSILMKLAKDRDLDIRTEIASNPNTPVSVLEQLLGDPEETILQIAVGRYLAKKPDGLPVVLQYYPKDSTPKYSSPQYSRLFILLHPQVPRNFLAEHSPSLWWWERYAVAQHPNTPPAAIKTLARDANRIVRAAARANLHRTCAETGFLNQQS